MSKRLANAKTRRETGLDYVVSNIQLSSPYGTKAIKARKPFFPGQESALKKELDKVEKMLHLAEKETSSVNLLQQTLMEVKDNTFTIERSKASVLSVVEIFEIKTLLLQMKKVGELFPGQSLPDDYILEDVEELLNLLDPRKDRMKSFYIYDEFSEKLAQLRCEKRNIEVQIRKEQKAAKEEIKKEFGISLTPKFEIIASKSDNESLEKLEGISQLERSDEDYMSVTFSLKASPAVYDLQKEAEEIQTEQEEEEVKVREKLSREIAGYRKILLDNCRKIGELDLALGKALYAKAHRCVKPAIVKEHLLEFKNGRNLHVEDILQSKGQEYCPVSISLADGVTCITGANMGGKTVSLKLAGMVAILTQYAFFVPCEKATVGLSDYMQVLIGDSQSLQRGLSSFGSEMEELKEILDNSRERSLLLIDEIASGTNPAEGQALTRSLIDHLKEKPFITLVTTHFQADIEGITNLQVVGLAGADFSKLDKEIRYANRKERINIIVKYMNYNLLKVECKSEIPKDALNIAKMLGINESIIERAKEYQVKEKKG